jgi:hypothetical protein
MCSSSTPSLPYAGVPGNGLESRRVFQSPGFTDHHREDAPMAFYRETVDWRSRRDMSSLVRDTDLPTTEAGIGN